MCFFFVIEKPDNTETETIVNNDEPKVKLPTPVKLRLMFQLLPFMIPLAIVYFGEYLINQGVSPGNFFIFFLFFYFIFIF